MTQRSDAILDRMMALHPKVIDLTLDRMWRLLDALGNPQDKLPPVVHIAGTNGKGSTLAMLRAGLEASGHRVHAYTSPHLVRFHERIRLAGDLIDEDMLSDLLDTCYEVNQGAPITYFEITTCAALLAFSRVPADYTLLEVGLGGRLDATNVIAQPALTMITPVSLDHVQFLGDTVEQIAGEKAGILKRGVTSVVSRQTDEAESVIEDRARRLGAPLLVQNQHWHVWEERGRLVYQNETGLLDLPLPALVGAHQLQNAGAALTALRHLGCGDQAFDGAVAQVEWPARMQRLKGGVLSAAYPGLEIWLDGGHNTACAQSIADVLDALPARETHVICGMMNTKDVSGFLQPLVPRMAALHAVRVPGEPNACEPDDIAASAHQLGGQARVAQSVAGAVKQIAQDVPNARVLICGSLYLAGHVLHADGRGEG